MVMSKRLMIIVMLMVMPVFASTKASAKGKDTSDKSGVLSLWDQISRRVKIMGRFDINFEVVNPTKRGHTKYDFQNYHHFLMIAVEPVKGLSFFGEIIDQKFYHIKWQFHPKISITGGKIIVPFGTDEYHHWYGGVEGDPAKGLLLPAVWAEYGANMHFDILKGRFALSLDLYAVQGIGGSGFDKTLALNTGSSADNVALGTRLTFRFLRYGALYASFYWSQYYKYKDIYMYAIDVDLGYNLVPVPFLRDVRVKFGGARVDIQNPVLGHYYKWADYIQVDFGSFRKYITLRVRYGTYIDNNKVLSEKNQHNFSVSVIIPVMRYLRFMVQWNLAFEEVNEINNDYIRVQAVLEF